jgi:hypothetical protein
MRVLFSSKLGGNNVIESLVLIGGENVSEKTLGNLSLMNAKQLVVGSTPGEDVVLHVAANSGVDLGNALLVLAEVSGVTDVLTLSIQIP